MQIKQTKDFLIGLPLLNGFCAGKSAKEELETKNLTILSL
jgi:hypothetical protein